MDENNITDKIRDMPKLQSPFVRELDKDGNYLITPKIEEGFEWVFEGGEDEVACTEKLDGTDVSIVIEEGVIKSIWNRTERLPFFNKGKAHIIEGVYESFLRGYCELPDGQFFGELIGPKLQGNPYKLEKHIWIPFNTFCRKHLAYKSFHKYPKTFEGLSKWLLDDIKDGGIFSLYMRMKGIEQKPEGIVFHNLKTGQMCKLRLDMLKNFKGKRHNDNQNKNIGTK